MQALQQLHKAAQTRKDVFRCSAGHTSKAGQALVMVPTQIRRVTYAQYATSPKGVTHYSETQGVETVAERPYCHDHASQVPALMAGEVTRSFRFVSKNPDLDRA
jgi:hypothetical protein